MKESKVEISINGSGLGQVTQLTFSGPAMTESLWHVSPKGDIHVFTLHGEVRAKSFLEALKRALQELRDDEGSSKDGRDTASSASPEGSAEGGSIGHSDTEDFPTTTDVGPSFGE